VQTTCRTGLSLWRHEVALAAPCRVARTAATKGMGKIAPASISRIEPMTSGGIDRHETAMAAAKESARTHSGHPGNRSDVGNGGRVRRLPRRRAAQLSRRMPYSPSSRFPTGALRIRIRSVGSPTGRPGSDFRPAASQASCRNEPFRGKLGNPCRNGALKSAPGSSAAPRGDRPRHFAPFGRGSPGPKGTKTGALAYRIPRGVPTRRGEKC
jgi:hypothetical protein